MQLGLFNKAQTGAETDHLFNKSHCLLECGLHSVSALSRPKSYICTHGDVQVCGGRATQLGGIHASHDKGRKERYGLQPSNHVFALSPDRGDVP